MIRRECVYHSDINLESITCHSIWKVFWQVVIISRTKWPTKQIRIPRELTSLFILVVMRLTAMFAKEEVFFFAVILVPTCSIQHAYIQLLRKGQASTGIVQFALKTT